MKFFNFKIKNRKQGHSLIELLFYISILALVTLVVIKSLFVMTSSFRETSFQAELIGSSSIMERMSREIRQSVSINTISANSLTLNTKDGSGVDKTVIFSLAGSDINFTDNGVSMGNLNTPNISVSSLVFTEITTTKGKAVKISLTLSSINDKLSRTVNFYNTIALRGMY